MTLQVIKILLFFTVLKEGDICNPFTSKLNFLGYVMFSYGLTYIYIYTSSIYPALPGQYRLKSSSWPGSGSGRGCLSGGGRGCLVVVVVVMAPVSQWWWSVSPRVFLAKIPFLVFLITMVTILRNF